MTSFLITGGAGFIGSSLAVELLKNGHTVVSFDNFNDFYDPEIKRRNIMRCSDFHQFSSVKGDIRDKKAIQLVLESSFDVVVHLASMAGVRPSIEDPDLYYDVNINGTKNVLDACQKTKPKKLIMASSSSVYGNNKKVPFSESDNVDRPISPYAATKKMNEVMAYNAHHLSGLPICCCRFFTVYGPYQRPEMAIYKFTERILKEQKIDVYNHGKCERDYTYIDDIVHGMCQIINTKFDFDVVNLGESQTISTLDLITNIENECGMGAKKVMLPSQQGDVERTYADISHAKKTYKYSPKTSIDEGIHEFVKWYSEHVLAEATAPAL